MIREENILLLQLILEDIRGNWGWDLEERLSYALHLAETLGFSPHIESINSFYQQIEEGYVDGRYFRMSVDRGGYEGMDSWHDLEHTLKGKTEDFVSKALEVLTYPEYRFDDYENFIAHKYKD